MALAAPTWVDIRTPLPVSEPLGLVTGYSALTVEVRNLERAVDFYSRLLGLGDASPVESGVAVRLGPDQAITLVERADPRTLPEAAVHQAYALPAAQLEAALHRLDAAGVAVETYHEDRDAERSQNRYCADPDGNRIQLVLAPRRGIDHVAVETHDVEWAEVFYTQVLDARVDLRVGWRMDDFITAWAWGNGEDQCAPGTRRWDDLYTDQKARVARPNTQLFVRFAPGVVLGVYLAREHRQEPPRGLFDGTPRTTFRVHPGGIDVLERRLQGIRLRSMEASAHFPGPYERVGDTLFVRDPGGNFLELRQQPA